MRTLHTPWQLDILPYGPNRTQSHIKDSNDNQVCVVASYCNQLKAEDDKERKANAQHIVKCVNCHDELLEILELTKESVYNEIILMQERNETDHDDYRHLNWIADKAEQVTAKAKGTN